MGSSRVYGRFFSRLLPGLVLGLVMIVGAEGQSTTSTNEVMFLFVFNLKKIKLMENNVKDQQSSVIIR